MPQQAVARSFALALLALAASAAELQAEPPAGFAGQSRAAEVGRQGWERALEASLEGAGSPSSLPDEQPAVEAPLPAVEVAGPAAPPPARALFATLSDNRLVVRGVRDARQARSAPSLDASGYEPRLLRAAETLSPSVQALDWPDLEGGSEPLVPTAGRSADGKRTGLGLGWRF